MAFTVLLLLLFRQKKANLVKQQKRKIKKLFLILGCYQETLRTFGIDFTWEGWGVFGERWW